MPSKKRRASSIFYWTATLSSRSSDRTGVEKSGKMRIFSKHADRDPDALLEFDPFVNEAHLVFTLLGLRRMGEVLGVEEDISMRWEALHRPESMREDIYAGIPQEAVKQLRLLSKRRFLEAFLMKEGKPATMGKVVGNFATP